MKNGRKKMSKFSCVLKSQTSAIPSIKVQCKSSSKLLPLSSPINSNDASLKNHHHVATSEKNCLHHQPWQFILPDQSRSMAKTATYLLLYHAMCLLLYHASICHYAVHCICVHSTKKLQYSLQHCLFSTSLSSKIIVIEEEKVIVASIICVT